MSSGRQSEDGKKPMIVGGVIVTPVKKKKVTGPKRAGG